MWGVSLTGAAARSGMTWQDDVTGREPWPDRCFGAINPQVYGGCAQAPFR